MADDTLTTTLTGLAALRWLADHGASFCRVSPWDSKAESPGKNPGIAGKGWQNRPLTFEQIQPYLKAGENVGLLCGSHSGNICLLDADEDFSGFLLEFPYLATAPAILREGGDKGKILIKLTGQAPGGKKWKHVGENAPFFELLAEGNQGVIPPSRHPSGVYYQLVNADHEIPELTLEGLDGICDIWTKEPLFPPNEPPPQHEPSKSSTNGSGLKEKVKAAWDPLKVFQHWGKAAKIGKPKSNGDVRLYGNGGLFVKLEGGKYTVWNIPGERGTGGDCITAWHWCKTGSSKTPGGRVFYELLEEMATAAGIPLPEHRQPEHQQPAEDQDEQQGEDSGERKLSQATLLVNLMEEKLQLFCDDSVPFAILQNGDHQEINAMRSRAFRDWMASQYRQRYKITPGSASVEAGLSVLCGMAQDREAKTYLRIAHHAGRIYLDLCNAAWEVVEISPRGWRIIQDPPIYFRRKKGMKPLPKPSAGGDLKKLRDFLNIEDDESWILLVAWLLSAYTEGPYPVLDLGGEQGTGKSTVSRVLRNLVDPNVADIRTAPQAERDLMIAAGNSWVLVYDNMSSIQDWLSDALCRISTGGGSSTRELWTNDEETIIDVKRPILVNGINDVVSRADLLGRTMIVNLPVIPEDKRKNESDFWAAFEAAQPAILGAILDAAAEGLGNLPNTQLTRHPRMADFARWIVAAEPALPWEAGAFMKAYTKNQEGATMAVLDDSLIADDLFSLMEKNAGQWEGTARLLLTLILDGASEDKQKQMEKWRPHRLSGELRRLAPILRVHQIEVVFHKLERNAMTGKPEKLITITRAQ